MKKVHDIADLLKDCMAYDSTFSSLLSNGAILNEYITVGCYPDDIAIEAIGQAEAQEALDAARQIRDAVVSRMSSGKDQTEQG